MVYISIHIYAATSIYNNVSTCVTIPRKYMCFANNVCTCVLQKLTMIFTYVLLPLKQQIARKCIGD